MRRGNRTCSSGTILLGVLAAVLFSAVPVAGRGPVPATAAPRERTADLAPALAGDGTFVGAPNVAGTIDTSAWTLVSTLAAGEAPRFAPAAGAVSPAAAGPWSALGSNGHGNGALNGSVLAIAVSGNDLYVGGGFTNVAGIATADFIARWNGSTWSALGSNGSGNGALNSWVQVLAVSGSDLYVGGDFDNAAGIATADHVARWNGSTWSALGSNGSGDGALNGEINALAVSGTNLYAGGGFTDAAGIATADSVARWNGSAWSALGSNIAGTDGALKGYVTDLAVSGNDLYVGGGFTNVAGIATADFIAKWNGSTWSALGSNGSGNGALNNSVGVIAVSGSDLYVGGKFDNAAGIATADDVAKWNGSTWSALGSNGSGDGALNGNVDALAVSGTDLFVGGGFTDAASIATADYVAKWNGSAWSALGANGSGNGALNDWVYGLAISGTNLYMGGWFTDAAGIATADYVAKWGLGTAVVRKPDGRIRLGTGAFAGDNVYNTTGAGQSKTGSAAKGKTISFGISIQNDGSSPDIFKIKATGTAANAYTVKYFRGTTDITAAVVAGTYKTTSLAQAATYLITAKVTVKSTAAAGSSVTRLVTITSVGNSTRKDAVKFIGKRA